MSDIEPTDEPTDELVAQVDAIIGRAFRWSLVVLVVGAALVAGGVYLTRERAEVPVVIDREPIVAPAPLAAPGVVVPALPFTDVTTGAGIDFVHVNGARGGKLLPETMGGGCAFLDHDGDGDQDLLLVNSMPWPDDAARIPASTTRLYANDGQGRFEDVTQASGLDVTCYGMGVAVGDHDNDGDPDIFLSALGPNRLLRNEGGVFTDVTDAAGVAGGANDWSTSAGYLDYDNDGDLDLFVCNYVAWSAGIDRRLDFTLNGVDRAYGPPKLYAGTDCRLYRNAGDGSFRDVSVEAGVQVRNPATDQPMAKALAVSFVDVDRDGHLDVFVANDTVQNFLFRNRGDGTFEEVGAASGTGFDAMGSATGAMGVDIADFANDGGLGIGIGNFANESTSFYVQQRTPWQFADTTSAEGIGSPSRLHLSFGLFFFDADLDGRLDLLQANGHLEDEINAIQSSQHYRQPAQLFWNRGRDGGPCFVAVPAEKLGALVRPIVGRGAAYADIDGDGDLDVLLTQAGQRPVLLRNDQDLGHHWLRLRLVGVTCNRDAIGACVELTADGVTRRLQVMPTRSYLSQVELPVTFGLGTTTEIESLVVRWPDGREQRLDVPGVDRTLVVEQSSP